MKQRIQFALAIKARQIIKATDVPIADEYLWDGSALRALQHLR